MDANAPFEVKIFLKATPQAPYVASSPIPGRLQKHAFGAP